MQGLPAGRSGEGLTVNPDRFLADINDWSTHRPLLYLALEETHGSDRPVMEMGMGHGSTPYLHDYCAEAGRYLWSYESDVSWCEDFARYASATHSIACVGKAEGAWDKVHNGTSWSVVLVDHAPGARRVDDLRRLASTCDIVVVHDTERSSTGASMREAWNLFKYAVDLQTKGAWASALSNTFDVTKWSGRVVGGLEIS